MAVGRSSNKIWWIAVVVLFLTITASIYMTRNPREQLTSPERLVRDITAPLASCLAQGVKRVQEAVSVVWNYRAVMEEIERLREQVNQLELEVARLRETERQNELLRQALDFRDSQDKELLAARVIGREPVSWYKYIVINRGSSDGVKPGMAVIAPGGVVGQVRQVTLQTAEVMLVLDPDSSIGGRIVGSDELVLVEGQANNPDAAVVRSLVQDSTMSEGDQVVTSGFSKIFPGGLPIGTIVSVERGAYGSRTGVLKPGADLAHLEVVFVLVDVENS